MSAPAAKGDNELKSHELKDISESLTPSGKSSQTDVSDTASTLPNTTDYSSVPLKDTAQQPASGPVQTEETSQQSSTGGGVTGFIRSLIGGNRESTSSGHASPDPDHKPEVTYETDLKHGTKAEVATAPGHSAVPEGLQQSPSPVGVAKTSFTEPVSEFAPALTNIAGDPEPSDPTKKYGHALDPLTGDEPVASPTSGGIISSVTTAATSALHSTVDTVKHVAGYDQPHDQSTGTGTATGTTGTGTGTGLVDTSSPGLITAEDLPKVARVNPHEDGSIDVAEGQATSLASRQAGVPPSGATGGSLTPSDLPKSGTVDPAGNGSADVNSAQRPGIIAAAVGSLAGGAGYVKDSVAGIIGGNQPGDTSEQIAALDRKNGVSSPTVPSEAGYTGAGPITQSSSTNQAGPIVTEGANESATNPGKKAIEYEDQSEPGSKGTTIAGAGAPTSSTVVPTSAEKTPAPATRSAAKAEPVVGKVEAPAKPTSTTASSGPASAAGIASAAGATAGGAGLDSTAKSSRPADRGFQAPQGSSAAPSGAVTGAQPAASKEKEALLPSDAGSLVKEVGPDPSNGAEATSKGGKQTITLPTGDVVEVSKPAAASPTVGTSDKSAVGSSSSKPATSGFAAPNTSERGTSATGTATKSPEGAIGKTADVSFSNPDGTSAATKSAAVPSGTTGAATGSAVNVANTSAPGASATAASKEVTPGGKEVAADKTKTGAGTAAAGTGAAAGTTGTTTAGAKPASGAVQPAKASFAGQAKDSAKEKKKEKGNTCGCCVIS